MRGFFFGLTSIITTITYNVQGSLASGGSPAISGRSAHASKGGAWTLRGETTKQASKRARTAARGHPMAQRLVTGTVRRGEHVAGGQGAYRAAEL